MPRSYRHVPANVIKLLKNFKSVKDKNRENYGSK